jgi:hypothetical protein
MLAPSTFVGESPQATKREKMGFVERLLMYLHVPARECAAYAAASTGGDEHCVSNSGREGHPLPPSLSVRAFNAVLVVTSEKK